MIVGHTLVDASSWTASVLMVNPNAEEVVLPSFNCVGKLVPVSVMSVALADPGLPNEEHVNLPEHLEEIIAGSHPSLGDSGRQLLRDLLYRYRHVFPAPGDPVLVGQRRCNMRFSLRMLDLSAADLVDWHQPAFGQNRNVFRKCYSGDK